jgi:hypothetical protein
VQISEMREAGQLQEVIRKNDFGSRIRNARVYGHDPQDSKKGDQTMELGIKTEDGDINMDRLPGPTSGTSYGPLPPQFLVLVLECGDCIFLFARKDKMGQLEFVISRFESPRRTRFVFPGYHLALDPSWRYMILGCAEGLFVVYELESGDVLNEQHARDGNIKPVKSHQPRAVQGVIHKMEFLFPRPEDDYHIILLLIVIKNGQSRMVIYEWELGDDLSVVFADEKTGQRLPNQHRMPLLVIPLTVRASFFAVSQKSIGVFKDALQGQSNYESVKTKEVEKTALHHGLDSPLWTAWARPFRRKDYYETNDNIYLAREDGVILLLEIDSTNILDASVNVGSCNCNISTAFATVYDVFADVLIIGGDSGPGTIWMVCSAL